MAGLRPAITFTIRNGVAVQVDEVENGLACGCSCPSCGERLVAKQGSEIAHHFAHEGGNDCKGGVQTALHLAAKAILLREKRMILPVLRVTASATDEGGGRHDATASLSSREVVFDEISEERRFGGVIPDICAKVRERLLFVEVAVSHFVNDEKLRRLAEAGVATVEIDLSGMTDGWDWVGLLHAIVEQTDNKEWLFNPKAAALLDDARKDADAKAREADRRDSRRNADVQISHEHQRASIPGFRRAIAMLEDLCDPKIIADEKSKMEADGPRIGAWISASRMLGIRWDSPLDFVNVEIPGESGILVDRRVWQAALFALFVRGNRSKSFSARTAIRWCLREFPRRTEFAVLQKHCHLLTPEQEAILPWASKAVSAYLRELEKRGFLKSVGDRYKIAKRTISSR